MNMISTGAFQAEMDASIKQETLAEKFARVWEKKNSKVARAGGVSLMALTLAACGSDDETTTTTETTTTVTPTPTPEPVGETSTLTDATAGDTVVGTAGDDVINGTTATFQAADTIVDSSSTDSDTLNITVTDDLDVAARVTGIENVNVTTTANASGGNTTLDVNVANITAATYTFDVNNAESLVATVSVTNADSGHYIATGDFADVDLAADTDADLEVTIGGDATVTTTGAADDLTVHGGGFDLTIDASAATEDLVVDGAVDATVTAASIAGNVTVTGTQDVSVTTAAAEGNVVVTAGRDVSLVSAAAAEGDVTITAGRDANGGITVTAAEGTVTVNAAGNITLTDATAADVVVLDNTGAEAGDDIVITNANSASSVTVTSVGAVTATANTGLAEATTVVITAAEDSTITVDGTTDDQAVTLNAAEPDGDAITFTLNANDVETLTLGGTSEIIVAVDAADISTETVTSTNTAGALLYLGAGNGDLTAVASNVTSVLAADNNGNTTTVDSDTVLAIDTEVNQGATATVQHETNATASTSNAFTLSVHDSATANGDDTANIAGMAFTDIQALTIALGADGDGIDSSADITGADLETVTVTGAGALDLNGNTITGDATNRVTLDASGVEGVVTMVLDATTNGVATITTGGGADAITVNGISGATAGMSITSGAGADVVTVTTSGDGATAIIAYNGGTGGDQILLNAGVDISDSTVTLTSVEQITLEGGGNDQLVSSALVSGNAYVIAENGTGAADLEVVIDALSVDLSSLVFDSSFATGTDNTIMDGSGNASSMTLTGSAADDVITGGTGADTISGGGAADTISGGAGADSLTGGAGVDTFVLANTANIKSTADTITDFASTDNIAIQATASGQFGDLHNAVGTAFDGATTGVVATVNIAGGAADLVGATANVISINADTSALTTGYATIAALQTAVDGAAITEETNSAAFADGDELTIVWYNTTDETYEIGIITIAGSDGFDGGDETYEKLLSVEITGDLTQAEVAAAIDYIA